MDPVSIGAKFGAMMFSMVSGYDEMKHMSEFNKQFTVSQNLVAATSKRFKKRLLLRAKRKDTASHNIRQGHNLSHSWTPTSSEKNPIIQNLKKSANKHYGPRRNKYGFNYGAQLCFMKDDVFAKNVGVSRESFEDLLHRISNMENDTMKRNHEVSLRVRLLMTVIYLTSKKVYRDIHDMFGYSEAAVCRLVYKTINEINLLSSNAIKWPSDLEATSAEFFKIANFPGVVGSVGTIHLVARAPEKLHDEYRNARGKYTIVLLATYDAQRKFTYVSVGYPGTYTDVKCLESTDLGRSIDHIPNDYFPLKKYHLIGSESFNLREGLLVPYKSHEIQSEDHVEFNRRLLATQELTSSIFVEMKSRFQTLTKLDMNIERAVEFATASCIIHNVCLDNNDPWTSDLLAEEESPGVLSTESLLQDQIGIPVAAAAKRDLIKDQIFMGLHYG